MLRAARRFDPSDVADMATAGAEAFGGRDVVVYLVDFGQQVLEPLGGHSTHEELPHSEPVAASVAGRAFLQQRVITAERPGGTRVWVPLVEGSEVTGVVSLTVTDNSPATLDACESLGVLVGFVVATHARVTDIYNMYRRRKAMSLAAGMQWDLLPPLVVQTRRIVAAGMVEPAYDVGGDCFDYAVNGSFFDAAVMDPMGHGARSAVTAALAMGCYRHDRRERQTFERMHQNLDEVIAAQFGTETFVTGQLARLELDTGTLTWTNAGHPPPLLIRRGHVVRQLACRPTLPWGLGPLSGEPEIATESLEPGDTVLFYTDGVVEAHGSSSAAFGVERLADLAGQHASDQVAVPMIVRLLIQAVQEHHGFELQDDATILLVQWSGSGPS